MPALASSAFDYFTEYVAPELESAMAHSVGDETLGDLVRIYPARGGKLLRPVICLATAHAFGVPPERVARFAVSLELLHNGLLIHDDFEDGSQLRRGQPTLHRMLGPALAVHVGDALLVRAFAWAFLGASGSTSGLTALAELHRAAATTEEGQAFDLLARERDLVHITDRDYYTIVLKKTAAYTTLLPMRAGATFAGITDERLLWALSRFALFCGLGFQIQDDLRSYGTSDINGKSSEEDILEGKVTLPLLRFFATANEKQRQRMRQFFARTRDERSPDEARWLAASIVAAGCIAYARQAAYTAAAHATHAFRRIQPHLVPGHGADLLAGLPSMVVTHR